MTGHDQPVTEVAQRVLRAAETASISSLNQELGAAEQFLENDQERLELLGAIAHDMRTALNTSYTQPLRLHQDFQAHLQLLRHLSLVGEWVIS